ncbi:MAG: radical SAM family heme chaperone HemW [Cephaloticoccus sp.]|nr:radical SAM family heme chaperone HemW [Cephaloticoccus sp.]MCF7760525.1 radical SAM family heme chaperone HemW [Cephaloticoccus sp.]
MSDTVLAQAKATPAEPLGLYVHVPFCASTCDFCAFYQVKPTADGVATFLTGIEKEADLIVWPRPVSTIFWGGGTPGLLSPNALDRLGQLVQRYCDGAPEEWTVEMAPASVTEARLQVLKDIGVTRISMGVQSFQPALLDALGRQHTLEQIHRAYDRVRHAEFSSVNLDLMFALPGQTEAEWVADMAEAVALAPDHLSTYCLTFEEDTALWVKLSQGRVKLDPEHEAQLYEHTWARLAAAGYAQYEVANFSRPGHACRHNLNTWRMHEWVGLGPSAASQHAGWRGANVADLGMWLTRLETGERLTEDRLVLTPAQLAEDALIFGLRMNQGVELAAWRERAPTAPWAEVDRRIQHLIEDGMALLEGGRLRLSDRGRMLADAVGLEMMEAFHEASVPSS